MTLNDRDAQLRVGAVESLDLTLPLPTPRDPPEGAEALIPMASRLFALASSPAQTLTLPVPTGVALGLSLGTRAQTAWGAPSVGVVTSRAVDPMGHQATVTLHLRASVLSGWNSLTEPDPTPSGASYPAPIG